MTSTAYPALPGWMRSQLQLWRNYWFCGCWTCSTSPNLYLHLKGAYAVTPSRESSHQGKVLSLETKAEVRYIFNTVTINVTDSAWQFSFLPI